MNEITMENPSSNEKHNKGTKEENHCLKQVTSNQYTLYISNQYSLVVYQELINREEKSKRKSEKAINR